jgi:hypothetical protein
MLWCWAFTQQWKLQAQLKTSSALTSTARSDRRRQETVAASKEINFKCSLTFNFLWQWKVQSQLGT